MESTLPDIETNIRDTLVDHRHYQLEIGDRLNAARRTMPYEDFVSLFNTLIEKCGVSSAALKQWRWVAGAIPAELRFPALTYGHFRAATSRPVAQRQRLLAWAAEKKMSPYRFAQALAKKDDALAYQRRLRAKINAEVLFWAEFWDGPADGFLRAIQDAANAAVAKLG